MRDWNLEWYTLHNAERAAFEARSTIYAEVTPLLANFGAPSLEVLAKAEVAEKNWGLAVERCNAFIEEYRRVA